MTPFWPEQAVEVDPELEVLEAHRRSRVALDKWIPVPRDILLSYKRMQKWSKKCHNNWILEEYYFWSQKMIQNGWVSFNGAWTKFCLACCHFRKQFHALVKSMHSVRKEQKVSSKSSFGNWPHWPQRLLRPISFKWPLWPQRPMKMRHFWIFSNIVIWTNFQITKLTCKRSTEELGELLALLKW